MWTYRTDTMDLRQVCLDITEASSSKVKEMVAFPSEARRISPLISTLMGCIEGQCPMLLHILFPLAKIEPKKIPADEILDPTQHFATPLPASSMMIYGCCSVLCNVTTPP